VEPDHIGRKIRCNQCEYSFSSSGPRVGIDSGTIPILDPVPELAPGPDNELLRRRVQTLEGEISRIRDELSARIALHTQASLQLQEAQKQLAQLAELEAKAAKAERFEQEVQARQDEIDRLRAELRQAPTYRGPPAVLDESIRQELDRLRAERESLRGRNAEADELRARIAELEQAAAERLANEEQWTKEIERARLEGDNERKALEEEWRRAHRVQLGAAEERLRSELARLQHELERGRRDHETLREAAERKLRDTEEEAKAQRIKAEELKRQRDAALEEIQAIQRDKDRMPQTLDAQRQALREQFEREYHDEIQGLEARLEEARALLRTEREKNARRTPVAVDFQAERQALQQTIARMQQQNEVLRRERDDFASKLHDLQQANEVTLRQAPKKDEGSWHTRLDVAAVCDQVEEREVRRELGILKKRHEDQLRALEQERDAALERVRVLQQAAQTPEADRKAWEAQWRRDNQSQLQAAEQKARETIEASQKQAALGQRTLQLEVDQCRQEIAAQRQWREATLRQLESLWHERDQAAVSNERAVALQRDAEGLRRERDALRQQLRELPSSPRRSGALLVGIVAALVGLLAGIAIMLARHAW
jgi:hypothetical protein